LYFFKVLGFYNSKAFNMEVFNL